jgi:hypothetical protein
MKNLICSALLLALALGCAAAGKKADIPSKMLPNDGKSESRAKGLGAAAPFVK